MEFHQKRNIIMYWADLIIIASTILFHEIGFNVLTFCCIVIGFFWSINSGLRQSFESKCNSYNLIGTIVMNFFIWPIGMLVSSINGKEKLSFILWSVFIGIVIGFIILHKVL